jgi:hypothetical protein
VTLRGIFVSSDGRLRAGWRILVFLTVTVAAAIAVSVVLGPALASVSRRTGLGAAADAVVLTLALVIAHAVMLRWVDRRPWTYVWLGRDAARPRVVGAGVAMGIAPIAAAVVALFALGWLTVEPAAPGSWLRAALTVSVILAPAALYEELLSRGYVLAALADGMGRPVAVGLTSVAFGLLHLGNPGATAQPIILVTLAGVFLAAVLLATGSLYAAWAAHFAWNWFMAVPLHADVSGLPVPRPGYQTVDSGPDWATGGPWGPEGGAFTAASLVAATAYLAVRRTRAA